MTAEQKKGETIKTWCPTWQARQKHGGYLSQRILLLGVLVIGKAVYECLLNCGSCMASSETQSHLPRPAFVPRNSDVKQQSYSDLRRLISIPQTIDSDDFSSKSKHIGPPPSSNNTTIVNVLLNNRNKQTHIGFLKVHKAASSTIQNILFRFGLKHNLKIRIPRSGTRLDHKGKALAAVVPKGDFKNYDIFACDTIYSKQLYDQLLPADSIKIGIIREPFERMVNAAYYFRDVEGEDYLKIIPRTDYIHNIVNHPEIYDPSTFSLTRNSMAEDFGFPRDIKETDHERITSYLDTLNKEFSLIMVTEHFEESLVLMRRLLRWSIEDIVFQKTNANLHAPTVLSDDELAKFKKTSFLDYAIYDYFLKIFLQKVQEVKDTCDDFVKEVTFVKTVSARVKAFCDDVDGANSLPIEGSVWCSAFDVTRIDCKLMAKKELPFIENLRAMYTSGIPIR